MNDFYLVGWESRKEVAGALAPGAFKLDHELITILENASELPFELQLARLFVHEDCFDKNNDLNGLSTIWLDYLPNSLAMPLMSNKLKEIVNENLTGDEGIDWILARVKGPDGSRNYYIPRFGRMLDVLDVDNTVYEEVTKKITRPHFSLNKINQLSLFHCPGPDNSWKITPALYVNFLLKKAIQKVRLTGMTFERAEAT